MRLPETDKDSKDYERVTDGELTSHDNVFKDFADERGEIAEDIDAVYVTVCEESQVSLTRFR